MNTIFKIFGALIIVIGLAAFFSPDVKNALLGVTNIFKPSTIESTLPTPLTKGEVKKLIKDDMQRFAVSINNKDMGVFYENLSDFWKSNTNVPTLNQAFAAYINSGIDLTVLQNMTPVIDKGPKITNNEDLYVAGHYNTTPSVVHFKKTYYLQSTGEWKLAEFFVEVRKQ